MKLLYQTHSPYARKVLVMADAVGLAGRIEVTHEETPCSTNRAPSARSTWADRIAAEADGDGDIAVAVFLANSGCCAARRIVPRSLGGHAACLHCRAWRDALRSRGRRS
jgi:hypothetical protein